MLIELPRYLLCLLDSSRVLLDDSGYMYTSSGVRILLSFKKNTCVVDACVFVCQEGHIRAPFRNARSAYRQITQTREVIFTAGAGGHSYL